MPTRHSAFLPIVSLFLCTTFLLASCTTQDNALGSEGKSDGGRDVKATDVRAVTCEQDGKTYQVGETVILSACTSCVCQADGTVGLCTGTCPPDAASASDGPVTCTQNGKTYQVGETVILSACTSCVCQADGTVGLCTGTCPPDAAPPTDVPITCTVDGKIYQVGERVGSGCVSCVCMSDGTWGECTGSCPPTDAYATPDVDSSPSALCTRTHGEVVTSLCCLSVGDFPGTCAPGACGCSPADSHEVSVCSCPAGTCFDPSAGCVGIPNVCTPGQDQTCNADPTSTSLVGFCGDDGSCLCIAGTTRQANGKCSK